MGSSVREEKKERITILKSEVKRLRAELAKIQQATEMNKALRVALKKSNKRFRKIPVRDGRDEGIGEFFLVLEITNTHSDIYIPLSVASGKKPTGFVYHIEGTEEGIISTTDISCSGTGVTQITLGTLLFAKIKKETVATFHIRIEIRGYVHHTYKIIINRINYKTTPTDPRYKKFDREIASTPLKFN